MAASALETDEAAAVGWWCAAYSVSSSANNSNVALKLSATNFGRLVRHKLNIGDQAHSPVGHLAQLPENRREYRVHTNTHTHTHVAFDWTDNLQSSSELDSMTKLL